MDNKPLYNGSLYKHSDLTEQIIGAFYAVVRDELPIHVYYDGQPVGEYDADLVVNDLVILEIKATKCLATEHEAQLLNYLKATPYEVGLLLNFGPKPET
jgi:GxxExxY protein